MVGFQEEKVEVRKLPHPEGGYCLLKDHKQKLVDFDSSLLRFHEADYYYEKLKRIKTRCLVNKWSVGNPIEFATYSVMKNIRHQSIVTFENYYEESGQPRIIISWVDGSLSAWLKRDGYTNCFKTAIDFSGSCPSKPLRQIIIDTCKGMEHLFQQEVFPTSVTLKDLFWLQSKDGNSIKMLISKADRLSNGVDRSIRKAKLLADIKLIFQDICKHSKKKFSTAATMFIDYIGEGSSERLENFPDVWTPPKKKAYLFYLVASESSQVRLKLGNINFTWPRMKDQHLFPLIQELLRYERQKSKPTHYNVSDGYDFLRLCRNVIKHWGKFSANVSGLKYLSGSKAFLRKMEEWVPGMWCTLYKEFGTAQ